MARACNGPGYASPLAAMEGHREEIVYVPCIQPHPEEVQKPDYLATIDVDPASDTFCQVISRCYVRDIGDEIHHLGWNSCSSCHCDVSKRRDKLFLPCLLSDNVYVIDVGQDPRNPKLVKTIEGSELNQLDCSAPHTSHCLPSGEVMISTMGDSLGAGKGEFVLIDGATLAVKGVWAGKDKHARFGYDFWYQPYWDIMISSEWGAPRSFRCGFIPSHIGDPNEYGTSLNLFSWKQRKLIQTIDLGPEGTAPLEIRFLHDPRASQGFVGCAVYSVVYRFYRKSDGTWAADPVIKVPAKKVDGWKGGDTMDGCITDILLSLDDRYLYFSNYLHGDIRQYDITDPEKPRLVGQLFVGGACVQGSGVTVTQDQELKAQPERITVKGRVVYGGPQMLQLSLDGKRLYVTSSLFSPWDKAFYPDMVKAGSTMLKVNVDTEKGGLTLDPDFLVDFGKEPDGPVLAHEIRYPGGDCTSDIWLANE